MGKQITLKSLTLTNFKGIKSRTIEFNQETDIYGDNGTGKTTIFDSLTWLLFGKDSNDSTKFNIKPLNKYNKTTDKLNNEVIGVFDVDGEEEVVKRVHFEKWTKKKGELHAEFDGNKTKYYWNDVPKNQKEFQEKVSELLDEKLFKLITNPLSFNAMHWSDCRDVLIRIVGDVSNQDIAEGNKEFVELLKKLSNKTLEDYKKELAAKRLDLKKEIQSLPARIDEVNRGLPEPMNFSELKKDKELALKEVEKIDSQISGRAESFKETQKKYDQKEQELLNLKAKNRAIVSKIHDDIASKSNTENPVVSSLKQEASKNNDEFLRLGTSIRNHKSRIVTIEGEIASYKRKSDTLRNQFNELNASEIKFDPRDESCPVCKRDYDNVSEKQEELKLNFNKDKATKLDEIRAQGKASNSKKEDAEKELLESQNSLKEDEKRAAELQKDINEIQSKIESEKSKVKESAADPEKLISESLEHKKNLELIAILEPQLQNKESVNIDDLTEKKESVKQQLEVINENLSKEVAIQKGQERIEELAKQENVLAQEISNIEKSEFVVQNFTKKKVDQLESKINDKFRLVKFKMFEILGNGSEIEACTTLINGVPFSDANNAAKINAGIEIINVLCDYYQVTAPIFVDNSESVTKFTPTNSQLIKLIVNKKHKTLTVK